MSDTFHSSKPIYIQLVERIKKEIVRNDLKPGDKLPSVREMALQSGVNPNTVQRTYRELESEEIAESKRGQGTFVTENQVVLEEMRQKLKNEEIAQFVSSMYEMGYQKEEILTGLEEFLNEYNRGEKG
ncbi:GntR family transcriptional regulator [Alkalihalobacillus alcalophilus ATCC 27647 = CGMCC 1.3604]|uniref:Transcriptional regulator n=1 Tax=Alkalihalobacillus alcalophilus ATCC 27647 = CGMCC 1.3604 TaxID=1218173 RepID=A0A094WLF6_ALKAL|nr:GntR family transcriptional regulator [Alkalihalobacillus alcalophilus]KGA98594.1 transcriptional regulator [Alkalihalobacillus alcalophilus ATCC 27647 = CGMCC 1.3604]MED1560437.1 GntR family transcriptional regulator [Alkalihalobacillus alcalophilus]THG90885.1 GntR family transcriptional regulator [Alkalihalobacillus alcalophilus ATCC 27647 = CGMCC 1.3604]